MKVIILAAGFATRLQPLTNNTAKPLLPIAGKFMIEYILDGLLDEKAIDRIYVVTNDKFYRDFLDWKEGYGSKKAIKIINDGSTSDLNKLGAIGDLNFVIENEKIGDDLLIVAGDNLFDLKLGDFIDCGKKNGITISACDIGDKSSASRFGVISINSDNLVAGFQEKPYNPQSSLVAMCLYFFPKEKVKLIERYLKEGNSPDAPGNYIAWLHRQEKVFCYVFKGSWFDIGSFESYDAANKYWEKQKIGGCT